MILEFMTAGLRLKGQHGQPLLFDAAVNGYRNAAIQFERSCGGGEDDLAPELRAVDAFASRGGDCKHILFVRPRSPIHATSAVGNFRVVQLSDLPGVSGRVEDQILHLTTLRWNWLVAQSFDSDPQLAGTWVQILVFEIGRLLDSIRPSLICLVSDTPPLERAISLVASAMGIPVATIQHGLFSAKSNPAVLEGPASDYFIVWGEYTRRLMAAGNSVPLDRSLVVGYPYLLKPVEKRSDELPTIVFFGQNFEDFDMDHARAKERIVSMIRHACDSLGIQFRYRPHPAEKPEALQGLVPEGQMLPRQQSLPDLFAEHEVFVGITSTALPEAGLYGRVAIQIYDDLFGFENLGDLGACYSCGSDSASIAAMLERVKARNIEPMPVSADYMPIAPDLAARFAEIYERIIADWPVQPRTGTAQRGESEDLKKAIDPANAAAMREILTRNVLKAKAEIRSRRSLKDRVRASTVGGALEKGIRRVLKR